MLRLLADYGKPFATGMLPASDRTPLAGRGDLDTAGRFTDCLDLPHEAACSGSPLPTSTAALSRSLHLVDWKGWILFAGTSVSLQRRVSVCSQGHQRSAGIQHCLIQTFSRMVLRFSPKDRPQRVTIRDGKSLGSSRLS